MTALRSILSATFLAAGLGSALARSGVGLGEAYPQACAPGYHADRGGNCQPNVAQVDRFCPPGLVYEPTFDGWRCDPPPPEAY